MSVRPRTPRWHTWVLQHALALIITVHTTAVAATAAVLTAAITHRAPWPTVGLCIALLIYTTRDAVRQIRTEARRAAV